MNVALLLGLLWVGHPSATAQPPDELAEDKPVPAGLVTGPVLTGVVGLPLVLIATGLCVAGPVGAVAVCSLCCAYPPVYPLSVLAVMLACLAPTAGCTLVGFDLAGFLVGQGWLSTINQRGVQKAALEDVGNGRTARFIRRRFQAGNRGNLVRDAAVGVALAVPAVLALAAAQVLLPLFCCGGCAAGASGAPSEVYLGAMFNGWAVALGLVGAAGAWWLLSAAVVRPLLLMALDAPPS